jgi:nitrous oxidase accessory protein NosD
MDDLLSGQYIADTATYTGNFVAIQALTATTLASASVSTSIRGTLTGLVIPAGFILQGYFTTVKLTSGTCVAYNAP